ncbi:MAG: glutathione S-transferase N-terminal domain-containing protein [Polyangiaceae bacterium]
MIELVGLSYSPWTEKARWALEHHSVSFRYVEHMPMVGELALRWRVGRPTGKATVPVLSTPGGPVTDSLAIAEYAEHQGRGARLFPAGKRGAIAQWNARSESLLAAARGLVVARTARNEGALAEALPGFVPPNLRRRLAFVAATGTAFFRAGNTASTPKAKAPPRRRRRGAAPSARASPAAPTCSAASPTPTSPRPSRSVIAPRRRRALAPPPQREKPGETRPRPDFADLLDWRDALFARLHPNLTDLRPAA